MKIRGLCCGTAAASNEEYRRVLKRRNIWMAVLGVIGALIFFSALMAEKSGSSALPEYVSGVYCGFGTGLAAAAFILFIRNLRLMRNEERLKQSRLENSDERLTEISRNAGMTALKILLLVLLAGGMIGGLYDQILFKALLVVLNVFTLSYIAAFAWYRKVM